MDHVYKKSWDRLERFIKDVKNATPNVGTLKHTHLTYMTIEKKMEQIFKEEFEKFDREHEEDMKPALTK